MRNLRRFYAVAIAIAMLVGMFAPVAAFATGSDYAADAQVLHDLGLYKGIDDKTFNPDLGSTLNRQTAATMVLRMFGLEQAALEMDEKDAKDILNEKFKDASSVDGWALKQVAYAVDNDIIKGFPDGTFQPKGLLTGKQYCTLVLKNLGYSDFTFEAAGKKFAEVSGISAADQAAFDVNSAIKKNVLVGISRKALDAKAEGATVTLVQQLVNEKVVKVEDATKAGFTVIAPAATTSPAATTAPTATPSSVPGATYGAVTAVNDLPVGNLITGSTINKVFKFNVAAPADKDMVMTSVIAKKYGTTAGDTTDIQRVYLLDGDSVLVSGTLNNGEVRLNKSVTIAKATTKTLTIAVDIHPTTATATRTVIMGIDSSSAIVSTPAVAPFTTALQGGSYSIIAASVGAVSSTGNSNLAGYTAKVGELNKDLGNFTITANSVEDLKLTNLTLTTSGLTASNFSNFYMYDETLTKIDVKGVVDGSKVTFAFGDKAPTIAKSNTKRFYLKGDITSGVSTTGKFRVENNYDIVAKGQLSGANVTVTLGTTPQNLTTSDMTISAGTPSVVDTANIPTKVLATSSQKGLIREFQVTSPSEEMNVTQIATTVTYDSIGGTRAANLVFANFYVTDENGNVIAGPVAAPTTTTSTAAVTFQNVNWYVASGTTKKFQIQATVATDSVTNTGVDVQINASGISYTLTTTNTQATMAAAAVPAAASTKALATTGSLAVGKDSTSVNTTKPAGSKNLAIARYLLTATDDKIKVTRVRITTTAGISSSLSGCVSNMGVYVAGKLVGAVTSTPTAATYFDLDLTNDPLYIEKGQTKQIEIKADLDQAPTQGAYQFQFDPAGCTAFSTYTNVTLVSGTTITGGSIEAGNISVGDGALALAAPESGQVVAGNAPGDTEIEFVKGKYSASYEDIKLTQIQLKAVSSVANRAVEAIKVYDGATQVGELTSLNAVNGGGTVANIQLTTPLVIPADGNKELTVKGKLAKNSWNPTETCTFSLVTSSGETKGTGVLSNKTIAATNGVTLPAGALTQTDASAQVAIATDSPTGNATSSSNMAFLKFNIKAIGGTAYIASSSAITITTGGTAAINLNSAGRAKLYKVVNGVETLVSASTATRTFVIGDTDGDGVVNAGQSNYLGTTAGSTVTLLVRLSGNDGSWFAPTSDQTMSVTLTNLVINDTVPGSNGQATGATIYNGDGSTDPVVAGNALKF